MWNRDSGGFGVYQRFWLALASQRFAMSLARVRAFPRRAARWCPYVRKYIGVRLDDLVSRRFQPAGVVPELRFGYVGEGRGRRSPESRLQGLRETRGEC